MLTGGVRVVEGKDLLWWGFWGMGIDNTIGIDRSILKLVTYTKIDRTYLRDGIDIIGGRAFELSN